LPRPRAPILPEAPRHVNAVAISWRVAAAHELRRGGPQHAAHPREGDLRRLPL